MNIKPTATNEYNARIKAGARLALREEGPLWVAYWAKGDTMKDAVQVGSIAMDTMKRHPVLKQIFMRLMEDVINDLVHAATGNTVNWTEVLVAAPEYERGGHA